MENITKASCQVRSKAKQSKTKQNKKTTNRYVDRKGKKENGERICMPI